MPTLKTLAVSLSIILLGLGLGITYFIIKDTSARAKSIRSDRVDMELRYLPRAETDAIQAQLGDQVVAAATRTIATHGVTFNVDKKPFDDERVRKAMTLALDRYDMAKTLGPIALLDTVGGPMHLDSQWGLSQEELEPLPGFGRDHEANLREAKRLLFEDVWLAAR
jgi:peptide/nickel transport system substrate-binding protein